MECLVQSGVVPLVLFVVKTFCDTISVSVGIVAVATEALTHRLATLRHDVHGDPAVSSRNAWVGNAFEGRGHEVAMFFSVRAPGCRILLEHTIICEPVTSDHYAVDVRLVKIHTDSSGPEMFRGVNVSGLRVTSKLTP